MSLPERCETMQRRDTELKVRERSKLEIQTSFVQGREYREFLKFS